MCLFDNVKREYHKDGSYTDRNSRTGSTRTCNKEGSLRQFTTTNVPLIGPTGVSTYNNKGQLINWQEKRL